MLVLLIGKEFLLYHSSNFFQKLQIRSIFRIDKTASHTIAIVWPIDSKTSVHLHKIYRTNWCFLHTVILVFTTSIYQTYFKFLREKKLKLTSKMNCTSTKSYLCFFCSNTCPQSDEKISTQISSNSATNPGQVFLFFCSAGQKILYNL